jgi:hypothetical protein
MPKKSTALYYDRQQNTGIKIRRRKYWSAARGLQRAESAVAEMQKPEMTKKSGTPTQPNRVEWKKTTARQATPRPISKDG